MKKRIFALLLCISSLCSLTVFADPGDEVDPVVSQSYLEQVWKTQILSEAEELIAQTAAAEKTSVFLRLVDAIGTARQKQEQAFTGARQHLGRLLLKQGDVFVPKAGAKFTVLSGTVQAAGSLADITGGVAVTGQTLTPGHSYMQKNNRSPGLTVQSATAELWVDAVYVLSCADGPDYGSLAEALSAMGLFRGMGNGFALEESTTRAQGLVMFLRLLGLEEKALACTADIPFEDVPKDHWAYGYVAYAYENGLTAGTSKTAFSPNAPVTAQHYVTFLFRALGYEENTDFSYDTALKNAQDLGLFREAEMAALAEGSLTRYKMVYLSYYALFCTDQESGTLLLELLTKNGVMSENAAFSAMAKVKSPRIS